MRLWPIIFLMIAFCTSCGGGASETPAPQPALDFPATAPTSAGLCLPADLAVSSNFGSDQGTIHLGITLINQSQKACTLANPASPELLESSGTVMDVLKLDGAAVQTPAAPELIMIAPKENVILSLTWDNYCQPFKGDALIVRLTLATGQHLDVSIGSIPSPDCTIDSKPSTLEIMPFSVPP